MINRKQIYTAMALALTCMEASGMMIDQNPTLVTPENRNGLRGTLIEQGVNEDSAYNIAYRADVDELRHIEMLDLNPRVISCLAILGTYGRREEIYRRTFDVIVRADYRYIILPTEETLDIYDMLPPSYYFVDDVSNRELRL